MNQLLIILICMLFSAFFSGMEIAFISSNKLRIEMDKRQGSLGSGIISIFVSRPAEYIATMLVGNNISLVIYSMVMAMLLEPFLSNFIKTDSALLILQTILSTLLILVTAEFLPKTLFRINPNMFLRIFAFPVFIFYILLFPLSKFTIALSHAILRRVFGVIPDSRSDNLVFGKIDLDHLVTEGKPDSGETLDKEHEIKIFQNALDFSNVKLRDCMVPRTEIVALEESSSIEELRQMFIETGLSKILIFRESTDNIIGYVNSKELFKNPVSLKTLSLSLPIVPETMPANKLLQSFISEHNSIAVVVDEFGGTSGIVTMEDIIEEILGEIEDEHDVSELTEKQLSEDKFIFSGRHEIDYLNEKYKLDIPKMDDYETLAGYILFHFENIPKVNDRIIILPYLFRILNVEDNRIELIEVLRDKEKQNKESHS